MRWFEALGEASNHICIRSCFALRQISVSAGVELTCHLGGRLTVFHASASPLQISVSKKLF
ncbi:MAG: hypothetical protein ABIE14_02080 [Patescibacteria group bacterium]